MSQVLYRKWRPAVWGEVKYQTHVVQTLKNAIAADKVAHAYIFSGPRGTGKTTAARLLAKAVNCLSSDNANRPCDNCSNCKNFNSTQFIDLIEIDAASHTGVDDARDLIEKVGFLPNVGKYKIYIIDEVHMLSKAAFNALLKTIEEPPPHVLFILATTELDKVMPTILSRCQRFEFKRFPLNEISDHLVEICKKEGIEADEQALVSIGRSSSGGMRDAISLLDQLSSTGEKITIELVQRILGTATNESVIELVSAIIAKDSGRAIDIAHQVLDKGASAQSFSRQVVEYLRNLLLVQTKNLDLLDVTPNVRENILDQAILFPTNLVLDTIKEFNNVIVDTRMGWSPALNLEMAIAKITTLTTIIQPVSPNAVAVSQTPTQPKVLPKIERIEPQDQNIPKQNVIAEASTVKQPVEVEQTAVKPASIPVESEPLPVQQKNQSSVAQANKTQVTLEQVRLAWERVDQLIFKKDKNYQALFKMGRLREVEQNTIVIVFPSDILANKFDTHKEREFVVEMFASVLGTPVQVRAVVNSEKGSLPSHLKPDGMVAVARELGGELKN